MRLGTKPCGCSASDILPHDALQIWTEVLAPTPIKRDASLNTRIGIFLYRLKEYKRNKKGNNMALNIRPLAHNFHCQLSGDLAFEVAALFTRWLPDFGKE